jgi:dolichol kinase
MGAHQNTDVQLKDQLLQIAQELYQFVSSVQAPRLADRHWSHEIHARCNELHARATAAMEALSVRREALYRSLDELAAHLRHTSHELANHPNLMKLRGLSGALAADYEKLLLHLRVWHGRRAAASAEAPLQHLKPRNYARNGFHLLTGLACVALYEWVLTWTQALSLLVTVCTVFGALELSRRFLPAWNDFLVDRVFGSISRPWERHRVNSSTWYLLALTIITLLMPKTAVELGILVLAVGDPAACLTGKRWGRRKLWREKSVVGTSAFFLVSAAACLLFLQLTGAGPEGWTRLGLIASVAAVGAFTELFSERLEDNFTVPFLCAATAYAWL